MLYIKKDPVLLTTNPSDRGDLYEFRFLPDITNIKHQANMVLFCKNTERTYYLIKIIETTEISVRYMYQLLETNRNQISLQSIIDTKFGVNICGSYDPKNSLGLLFSSSCYLYPFLSNIEKL